MSKSKILLLFCGGTIAMKVNQFTGAANVTDEYKDLTKVEPEILELADITTHHIDNIDSTNMIPEHWEKLTAVIGKEYSNYDGFLITMGTNTLAYASSALSYSLAGIGKPVVITGAQIPSGLVNTDAKRNLINSVKVASMDVAGVFVVFGTKIIRGCRAKKVNESNFDAFHTFNNPDFGNLLINIKINDKTTPRHNNPFVIKNGFESNVFCVTLIPGLKTEYITQIIDNDVKGLIIRSYGSGDIPYYLLPALEHAREKQVPIIITTQCPMGTTIMGLSDVGLQALNCGVIQAFDMSLEAISTKLMWLLKQNIPYHNLRAEMHNNICGEVDTSHIKTMLNQKLTEFYKNNNLF